MRVNDAVESLNAMSGCPAGAAAEPPTAAQASALEHLRATFLAMAPSEVPPAREAFDTLRGVSSPYGLPTNLAGYLGSR